MNAADSATAIVPVHRCPWQAQRAPRERWPYQVPPQRSHLGRPASCKVDEGGGGTVAKFLAEYGMDIVDMGPALLSMHSPFELSSKVDTYSTYLAYRAFMEDRG